MKAKKVVTQAFNKEDVIDYLFISHLDYDHISLAFTLIERVQSVGEIVLPLVRKDELNVGIALNRISGHNDAVGFLQMISDRMSSVDGYNVNQKGPKIVLVGGEEEDGPYNVRRWYNGSSRSLGKKQDWVLIPYNVKLQDRREELILELDKLLKNDKLIKKLDDYSSILPSTGAGLYDQLTEPEFVKKVIASKELRNAIKSAYEKVTGGVNANSMLLYSGPESIESEYRIDFCSDYCDRPNYSRPGCLYTGDAKCELPEWKTQKFDRVWDCIGTIQLPHHGSLASFEIEANPIDGYYVFPVSCGSTNSYGHPSGKVLAYLMINNCKPKIITELGSTVYMQRIRKRRILICA